MTPVPCTRQDGRRRASVGEQGVARPLASQQMASSRNKEPLLVCGCPGPGSPNATAACRPIGSDSPVYGAEPRAPSLFLPSFIQQRASGGERGSQGLDPRLLQKLLHIPLVKNRALLWTDGILELALIYDTIIIMLSQLIQDIG